MNVCENCNGSGVVGSNEDPKECEDCNGFGSYTEDREWIDHDDSDWDVVSTPQKPKDRETVVED